MEDVIVLNEPKKNKIVRFFNYIFKSKLNTFIALTLILSIFMVVLMVYPTYYDTFLNYHTDDVAEYHIYIDNLFRKIKTGTLSLYEAGLYGGTSFFSGVYYFAIDFFTVIAFVLSYFIPTAMAFTFATLLRVMLGSFILYSVFIRKGFKPFVSFLISFIYFVAGVTQSELVFPVYVGICFYAPLIMLVVDVLIEKGKKYWLFVPLLGATMVVYDYYISYMLFAFMAVYFVVEEHLYNKKFFLATKKFYIDFILLISTILFSVILASCMALPSIYYMLNESLRNQQPMDKSIWLFAENGSKTTPWLNHYFTQWCNIFMPNDPFSLCLNPAGKYIREHATLYITSGGLIYLAYFFFIWGKTENRLKLWVILLNVMFAIPLFAMIFTFNGWPYVRWFFIPLLINLYAAAMAMNKKSFNIGVKPYTKILPIILLALGFGTLLMVLITKTDLFMHYKPDDDYFYPILIGSLIFIGIYLLLMLIIIIFEIIKKYKALRIMYFVLPLVIFAEAIFSGVITFSSVGSQTYIQSTNTLKAEKNQLYEYGYKDIDGYRSCFFTSYAKSTTNTNLLVDRANMNSFFQSFYNTPLNYYYNEIYNMSSFSGWSRSSIYGYGLLDSIQTNTKYIIEEKDCQWLKLPEKYYTKLGNKTIYNKEANYYELKDMPNFIVYDSVFELNQYVRYDKPIYDIALLNSAYISTPKEKDIKYKLYDKLEANMKKVLESNVKHVDENTIISESMARTSYSTISFSDDEFLKGYSSYELSGYKTQNIFKNDVVVYIPNNEKIHANDSTNIYFYHSYIDDNGDKKEIYNPLLYNVFYPKEYETINPDDEYYKPEKLVITKRENTNSAGKLYGFSYDIYDEFIEKQNEYKDRLFELNKNKMHIKFKNNDSSAKIIKTAYAYSDDWIIETKGYETCNINGGFLGIIVDENVSNIDINLTYKPEKFDLGCKISIISSIIYTSVVGILFAVPYFKKKKKCIEERNEAE